MEKVTVTVESGEGSFSAFVDILPGCITTGKTIEEIERNMEEAITGHLAVSKEYGDPIPEEFRGEYELEFHFDVSTVLDIYSGIFTKASLGRITGINERQIWHYATGEKTPRDKQKQRIEEGLHKLGRELLTIKL